jgi:DNA-binding transcriptional ArsR family regulator
MTAIEEIEELLAQMKEAAQALELALSLLRGAAGSPKRVTPEVAPTGPENPILGFLHREGEAHVQDIAGYLGIQPSATNQRLLVLKKKKLVKRVRRGVYRAA